MFHASFESGLMHTDYERLLALELVFHEDAARFVMGLRGAARARDGHAETRPDLQALSVQLDFNGFFSIPLVRNRGS